MSAEQSPTPPAATDAMALDVNNPPRKSYRRKYRKSMVTFEERMRESTSLFKDEQRIFDISQRLAEQTDQILQLLLELNESPEIPSNIRYDLSPSSRQDVMRIDRHQDEQSAHESLRVGRYKVQKGEQTLSEYDESKEELLKTIEFRPAKSYASLSKDNHIVSTPPSTSSDPSATPSAGYLTIRQEEQYLQGLDSFISGKTSNPRSHVANSLGSKVAEKTTDREREMQLRNPVSVYNWLRRYQPQVFLQDHETSNDKGGKISSSRSSKRTAANKEVKQEPEYDEDGFAMEYTSVSKGKRKRNDDGAFRPKGFKSGHGLKRRKDESGRRSKRSSIDTRIS